MQYRKFPYLLSFTVLVLGACSTVSTSRDRSEGSEAVTLADAGRTVTVTGEVEQVLGPKAFVLDNNDVLVVARHGFMPSQTRTSNAPFMTDDDVEITGTVMRSSATEIERDYGIDLDAEWENRIASRPVIVAQSVRLYDRDNFYGGDMDDDELDGDSFDDIDDDALDAGRGGDLDTWE